MATSLNRSNAAHNRLFEYYEDKWHLMKTKKMMSKNGLNDSDRKKRNIYEIKMRYHKILSDAQISHQQIVPKANHKKNIYKAVKFTTEPGSNRTALKYDIDSARNKTTYVHNNPIVGKRINFSKYEWDKPLRIHKDDKALIKYIKNKK